MNYLDIFTTLAHKVHRKITSQEDISGEIKQGSEILVLLELREPNLDLAPYRKEMERWRQYDYSRTDVAIELPTYGERKGRERMDQSTQKLLSAGDCLRQARRVAEETVGIGTATLSDLDAQEEQIRRQRTALGRMQNRLSEAGVLIRQIDKKILCSRLLIVLIIISLFVIFFVSIISYMYYRL